MSGAADAPRWLDDDQQRAWRALASVLLRLPPALERQLRTDSDLSHFDYWVMALLSEAPDRTLRLSELAMTRQRRSGTHWNRLANSTWFPVSSTFWDRSACSTTADRQVGRTRKGSSGTLTTP